MISVKFEIRKAKKNDMEQVIHIDLEDLMHYHSKFDSKYYKLDKNAVKEVKKFFLKSLTSKKIQFFVAVSGDEVLGYSVAIIEKRHALFKIKEVGGLSAVVMKKKYQKKGIGTALIKETLSWLRKMKMIKLVVDVRNKYVMKLYEKMGFEGRHLLMVKYS